MEYQVEISYEIEMKKKNMQMLGISLSSYTWNVISKLREFLSWQDILNTENREQSLKRDTNEAH